METFLQEKVPQILNALAETAQLIFDRGWAEGTAGNISINVTDLFKNAELTELVKFSRQIELPNLYPALTDKYFLITLANSRMRDLSNNPVQNITLIKILSNQNKCVCYFNKQSYAENRKPSSELSTHLGIHNLSLKDGRSANVVIHTHATELIVLTHNPKFKNAEVINKLLWSMHPEVKVFIPRGLGFVPYTVPGSRAIAEKTIEAISNHDLVIWEKHGIFAIGNSLDQAIDTIEIACKAVKIYLSCLNAGFQPEGITEHDIRALADFFNVPR